VSSKLQRSLTDLFPVVLLRFVDFWPSLFNFPGFLQQFIPPIVKVKKGKRSDQFITQLEYEHWLESTGNNGEGCYMKDYKGLDISTSAEAKKYVFSVDVHEVEKDLISNCGNDRSIPHLVDGLNPLQRKVLYGCFKQKLDNNESTVAQLVGYVAEHSAYNQSEASIQGAIVNMAQNFVGSNNVNLLTPSGPFGTRRMGGVDAASAHYIFTKLESIARTIFHPDDDELLNYSNDYGSTVEPEFYVPVIPLALCNGAEGVGTGTGAGWSSKIANYSPLGIVENLRRKIAGEELVPMAPFYRGFKGSIKEEKKGKYVVYGNIERVNETNLLITEMPSKKWTQKYKKFLEGMLTKTPPEIKCLKENHAETTVSFTVVAEKEKIDEWENDANGGLHNKFQLTASISTTNMTLYDEEARLIRYDTPEDIVNAFYPIRRDYYNKRKANLVIKLESEINVLRSKKTDEHCKM
jgi:DNA topoisomerase II